ncbi:hypothetical protein PIB30_015670 [Stylosanthes scabra]|uniref:Secreted protein n=1 Tax=Stylosanthes scabra TaxID=79078 RepID=A0ABU6U5W1_9FABA|nr:hypothetical protein [Stylosanthes scabra]
MLRLFVFFPWFDCQSWHSQKTHQTRLDSATPGSTNDSFIAVLPSTCSPSFPLPTKIQSFVILCRRCTVTVVLLSPPFPAYTLRRQSLVSVVTNHRVPCYPVLSQFYHADLFFWIDWNNLKLRAARGT